MVPAITSPRLNMADRNGPCFAGSISNSRETTPAVGKLATTMVMGEAELLSACTSDLKDIKNLVTCSICDQLLYEPWTLGCGHTYCYSCLCNWFVPNKRKKTCPECRTSVKQMPAPAFLVKQMVEIFIRRGELMPPDESIAQHQKKQAEEIADADKDRNGTEGLFKGTFPAPRRELIFDDGDGVFRCPRCLSEHEGGPTCTNCDLAVEHDFHIGEVEDDFDLDDLDNLEVDLDDDLGDGLRAEFRFASVHQPYYDNPLSFHEYDENDSDDSDTGSSELGHDDDDSLNGFIVPDEERSVGGGANQPIRDQPINISDDDSDEDVAIAMADRRQRRAVDRAIRGSFSPSSPSMVSVSSSSVSEANEVMLQRAGWSPLDQGNESDLERHHYCPAYASEEEHTDGNETETVGNGGSDDGSDRSETPRYEYPLYGDAESSDGDEDNESEIGSGMDRDGDTEMSVSSSSGRYRSDSAGTDAYGYGEHQRRVSSVECLAYNYEEADSGVSRGSRVATVESEHVEYEGEELGSTNQVHDLEDDSSDESIVPPPRRHRRPYPNSTRAQQYFDPRISVMLAQHRQIRGAQDLQNNLAQLEDQMLRRAPIIEPASRNRRMTAYRRQPPRRIDPLRSSRSHSATRVISSSNRPGRLAPLYSRRN